jgi:hypothetical protein
VQIDIEAFKNIEEILENYALVQSMKENEGDETLHSILNRPRPITKPWKKRIES